jgi:DNA polymerase III delta prime subunit
LEDEGKVILEESLGLKEEEQDDADLEEDAKEAISVLQAANKLVEPTL